ncbi:hypothetical protein PR048_005649 [Dryococelus australis]|uniref:Uncharacterized protein n=1 Tax=Dryococelus australis TaxID=614101 RepID=A0ABQ9I8R8_9NEOP|nr:hypothetical protein PR048_005649 [Dryococelus australis]
MKFHPYKMAGVQELSERDCANSKAVCESIPEAVPTDAGVLSSDEGHFHLSGFVQSCRYWAETILVSYTSDPFTENVLLSGALSLSS